MAGSNPRPDANRDGGVKLIVGLGNPGIEYQFTPHNLGFLTIDRIARSLGVDVRNRQCRALTVRAVIADQTVLLAKPETFMNLSGVSVRELVQEYEAKPESDLIVIQDELDFPLGTLRIHTRRSSAGHNGIESIIGALGTQDFLRIRIGVAPSEGERRPELSAVAAAPGRVAGGGWNFGHRRGSCKGDFERRSGSSDESLQPERAGRRERLATDQHGSLGIKRHVEISGQGFGETNESYL